MEGEGVYGQYFNETIMVVSREKPTMTIPYRKRQEIESQTQKSRLRSENFNTTKILSEIKRKLTSQTM